MAKYLNNDESKSCGIDSDDAELLIRDTNVLIPTTPINQSMGSRMMTIDAKDEDTNVTDSSRQEFRFEAEAEDEKPQIQPVSVPNGNTSSTRLQQQRQLRILSSQSNFESDVDTFEEAFSKHRYAGSFRLRFCRDELLSHANRAQENSADTINQSLESQIMTNDAKDKDTHETSFTDSDSSSKVHEDKHPQAVDQEQTTVNVSKGSTNRQKQILRIVSSQGDYESNVDTFEEAFSKHRYAGSFRLRFCRDEVVSQENQAQVNSADTKESEILVLHDEIDVQELPEPATPPCKKTVMNDSESNVSEMESDKGPTNLMTTELYINDVAVQKNVNGRDPSLTVNTGEVESSFQFYPPEVEPILHPTFKQRAEKAVSTIIQTSDSKASSCCFCSQDCTDCCSAGFTFESCATSTTKVPKGCHFPHFSVELKAASRQGTKMLRSFLFPTMPKLLTDFWVLAEFGVTLAQFILSVVSIMIESNRTYSIIYLVLASLALLLAFVDAFIYFKDFATCSHYFHCSRLSSLKYRSRVEENQQHNLGIQGFSNNSFLDLDVDVAVDSQQVANDHNSTSRRPIANYILCRCCHLGDKSKLKAVISESLELTRTILSELLIYPLLMFDLLDVIVGGSYRLTSTSDRLNLSLFVIGTVFLILSVYVSRAFMVISMTIQLRRMPIDPSKSKANILGIVTEFCIYVLFQISVHVAVVMAVGAKLYQENPTPCENLQASCTQVSPTLIYAMVCGGILPIYGILVFFILNYFQLQEISVGFWTNMVSLLHSENFSNLVFSTKGIEETKMKAEGLINSIHLHQVKSQLKRITSTPSWAKTLYPLKFPFFIPVFFLYVAMLFSFIAALAFTYEQNVGISFTLFENNFSPAFFILSITILAANLHILVLVFAATLGAIVIILTTILQPVFCLLGACAYVPVGGCLSLLSLISPTRNIS